MKNIFEGININWGFTAGDIFKNALDIVGFVAAFVLLGLSIRYVPAIIQVIKYASYGPIYNSKWDSVKGFFREVRIYRHLLDYEKRRGG